MRIPILTFGAIASVLTINSVMADTVVTSRNYVDTQDALKQNKITAGTTGSVVTYNGTQNGQTQFSERAIFNPETGWDDENGEIVSGHEGDLLDAGSIFPNLVGMGNAIQEIENNMDLPKTTVAYKTCTEWVANAAQTDENCLLWALDDKNVYGGCTTNQDCDGRCKMCVDGACVDNPNCQA